MALITLNGMNFFAYHGCTPVEREKGNNFTVDFEFFASTEQAEITDDLAKTIDYKEVYTLIKKEMEQPSALLEHVARRIIDAVSKAFPLMGAAKITLSKLKPALGGEVEKVSVTLNKKA